MTSNKDYSVVVGIMVISIMVGFAGISWFAGKPVESLGWVMAIAMVAIYTLMLQINSNAVLNIAAGMFILFGAVGVMGLLKMLVYALWNIPLSNAYREASFVVLVLGLVLVRVGWRWQTEK